MICFTINNITISIHCSERLKFVSFIYTDVEIVSSLSSSQILMSVLSTWMIAILMQIVQTQLETTLVHAMQDIQETERYAMVKV